jgi:hypothetical protein
MDIGEICEIVVEIKGVSICGNTFYPALTGSKPSTSKFSGSKEVRWGSGCP